MSARRAEQPFTRGSTYATVMVVIFVVGTIAAGVAYYGNREWGEPEVADVPAEPTDAAAPLVAQAPVGDASAEQPQMRELLKSPVEDIWPSLTAPEAPPLLASEDTVRTNTESQPLERPELPMEDEPRLPVFADVPTDDQPQEKPLAKEPMFDGPLLADPRADEKELKSDLYSKFDDDFNADAPQTPGEAAEAREQAQPLDNETEVAKVAPEQDRTAAPLENLQQAAASAGTFKTFLKLTEAAGLDDLLQGEQFHTVIAPTDKAFEALPRGTVAALLLPKHRDKLEALLAFHVLPGNYSTSTLANRRTVATVGGQRLRIDLDGVVLKINGAPLAMPSIYCRNGVLHGVDRVLLPVADNLAGVLALDSEFQMFRKLLDQAGMSEALSGDDNLTLFAPTDEAFRKVPDEVLARLVQPENKQLLKQVLSNHLLKGRTYSQDLLAGDAPQTLSGKLTEEPIRAVRSGDAAGLFARADLEATNGVVHKVNRVLLPPQVETTLLKPIDETTALEGQSTTERWRLALERAVAGGKSLYNEGSYEDCSRKYEQAMQQLLQSTPESELPLARDELLNSLTAADRADDAKNRAWALRRGINRAYAALFEAQ